MNKSRHAPDIWLLLPILALLAIGMVMVYSAGSVLGFRNYGDSFYFVKRQLLFAGLGLIAMFITANTDYVVLKKFARPALIFCFVLLVLVLVPGIGVVRGGARSWLGISSFGIQPSEFMKMGMILFLAKWLGTEDYDISSFTRGLLPPLALIGSAFALIMLQPDLGTGTVMFGAALMMVFTAGARMKHLLSLGALGVAGFVGLIAAAPTVCSGLRPSWTPGLIRSGPDIRSYSRCTRLAPADWGLGSRHEPAEVQLCAGAADRFYFFHIG